MSHHSDNDIVIRGHGLGKHYRIEHLNPAANRGRSLVERARSIITDSARNGVGKQTEDFWALRDVNIEVARGEVMGIVGRNGVGKSTLLKILSRIIYPSEGWAEIRGRVGSLLEVGTGFHNELSGRENIYLNGAILGMKRAEINAKFDEIVEFSGVERFLDTPVKRYSSGMRVRLAFSVAAHLEPEILIVDEVLAVGDAAFQTRCLGKLHDVASNGRTVLFVSHNLGALRGLCTRGLLIEDGRVAATGSAGEVVDQYLHAATERLDIPLAEREDRSGNGALRFVSLDLLAGSPPSREIQPAPASPLVLAIGYESPPNRTAKNVRLCATVRDVEGRRLFVMDSRFLNMQYKALPTRGQVLVEIPRLPLAAGDYEIDLWSTSSDQVADYIIGAARFGVVDGNPFGTGRTTDAAKHGPYVVDQVWHDAEALEGIDTDWIQRVTSSGKKA